MVRVFGLLALPLDGAPQLRHFRQIPDLRSAPDLSIRSQLAPNAWCAEARASMNA
jgi:hypothetical protein